MNFASIGNIWHEDGTFEENVPFVFNVDDVALLRGLVRGVTVSRIMSSIRTGEDDGEVPTDIVIDH